MASRELENSVERMVLLSDGETIDASFVTLMLPTLACKVPGIPEPTPPGAVVDHGKILTRDDIADLEKEAILEALEECGGIKSRAAKELGMTVRQIGYKMKKYGID